MDIQVFQNEQFGSVRTLLIDTAPWFVGIDVAKALGYSDTDKAIKRHVDEEDRRLFSGKELAEMASSRKGGETPPLELDSPRGYLFINESGLYSLILGSKLPAAKEFKRWVTAEVLPAIRETGSYTHNFVNQSSLVSGIREIGEIAKSLEETFGVGRGIALAHSINVIEKFHALDLSDIKSLCPPADNSNSWLNASQLGMRIGMSARSFGRATFKVDSAPLRRRSDEP